MFKRMNQSLKTLAVMLVTLTLLAVMAVPVLALESGAGDVDLSKTIKGIIPTKGLTVNDFENNHNPAAARVESNVSESGDKTYVLNKLGKNGTGSISFTVVAGNRTTYISTWTASKNLKVLAIYVKGGNGYNIYSYEGKDFTTDGLLVSPAMDKNTPAISHITVVFEEMATAASSAPSATQSQPSQSQPSQSQPSQSQPSQSQPSQGQLSQSQPSGSLPTETFTDESLPLASYSEPAVSGPSTSETGIQAILDDLIPQTGEAFAQYSIIGAIFIALAVALIVFKRSLRRQY